MTLIAYDLICTCGSVGTVSTIGIAGTAGTVSTASTVGAAVTRTLTLKVCFTTAIMAAIGVGVQEIVNHVEFFLAKIHFGEGSSSNFLDAIFVHHD